MRPAVLPEKPRLYPRRPKIEKGIPVYLRCSRTRSVTAFLPFVWLSRLLFSCFSSYMSCWLLLGTSTWAAGWLLLAGVPLSGVVRVDMSGVFVCSRLVTNQRLPHVWHSRTTVTRSSRSLHLFSTPVFSSVRTLGARRQNAR